MDRVSRYSWFRSARPLSVPVIALIGLLGAGGYVLTSTTIRHDQNEAAERRARVVAVDAQEVLGRARAYVAGLGDVLAGEHEPGPARFARWARATSASVGLNDVLWVQPVSAADRGRYEREHGVPITRLTPSGHLVRAPEARAYLPATLTSRTRPELRRGVDVSSFAALDAAIHDRARIFAVGASRPGALGTEAGFYLLEAASFAGSRDPGYLVAFVPRGWFSTTLGGDPRRVAISEDGRRIEGRLDAAQAGAAFEMLGRQWRIDVGRDPPSGLQSLLPWLALAWPFAVAALALPIGQAITLRRRAKREVERIFDLSLDLISVIGFDGRFKAVNPAFERTLGYSQQEMLARPYADFVHPDDAEASQAAFAIVVRGEDVSEFENRYICADGSARWLQWNARAVPEQQVMYGIARDVTERRRIDAEQAVLRRVATLIAREASQLEVFTTIAEEIGKLLGAEEIRLLRFAEDGRSAIVVGSCGSLDTFALGDRQTLDGENIGALVQRTGTTARIDDYGTASGPLAERLRAIGVRSGVGAPIIVEGRLWGAIAAGSTRDEPLPPDTERRLGQFTELLATAVANTESRARADLLAEEQNALRRIATLIAKDTAPQEVFAKVAEEVVYLLGDVEASIWRDEGDGTATVVGVCGVAAPIGTRMATDGDGVIATVLREHRTCSIDHLRTRSGAIVERGRDLGMTAAVGCPVVVRGRVWGALGAATTAPEPFPQGTKTRMEQFADLVATAIANATARAEVERLANEQAALRRVATLVAEGARPSAVRDAVAAEMQLALGADGVMLGRYELDDEVTVVAHRGSDADKGRLGARVSHRGENLTSVVRRSEQAARLDASVGSPIVVEGRLWGVAIASWNNEVSPPADTEERITQFVELLETAIANADSRDQLTASRARLLTANDDARRRVVRDLHDGAQQRLVHTIVALKLAERALGGDNDDQVGSLVGEALTHAERGNAELRELAHGILPASLTHGGLRAGVDSVVARTDLPVIADVTAQRFPRDLEASAYFIVAEALTNVVKHAHATRAFVTVSRDGGMLHVEVRDDGIGGADPTGDGLVGLADRATALGGRLTLDSPANGGTRVIARMPLADH
jgi:PAS domain S-box-containing protein